MTQSTTQPTANQIKHRLRTEQGLTLKAFASMHGFSYRTVSDVVRGLRHGNFGEGREVRIKLGLPVND
ncbi:DNA-binding protein [Comamonas thiooxydans]|uniref:hypothetical protein n=1 Tax=Comamonas TaxID=283 RepID=UPI000A2D2803|nr:hypothetical protein [Comamonas thiooxydans]BDR08599.1 DNA-binding protein [Comamonas thiooxydans]